MQGARLNVNTRRHHWVENALGFSNSHGKCTRPLRFDHLGHSSLSSAQARYCAHRRRVVLLNNATKQLVYAATAEDALVVLRKACTLKSVPTDEVIKNLTTVKDDFKRSPRLIKG